MFVSVSNGTNQEIFTKPRFDESVTSDSRGFLFLDMKANELRIGNYVDNYSPRPITGEDIYLISKGERHCPAIPLTEEWLFKLGLKNELTIRDCQIEIYRHFADESIWFFNICSAFCFEIKYVHQLQNLYFSLTGEELEIK